VSQTAKAVRAKPELFKPPSVSLIDGAIQGMLSLYEGGRLDIEITPDNEVLLTRTGGELFDPDYLVLPMISGDTCLVEQFMQVCIKKKNRLASYLASLVFLSPEATFSMGGRQFGHSQCYREGQKYLNCVASFCGEPHLAITTLTDDVFDYTYRVRIQELAALYPGINIKVQYRNFAPVEFRSENGLRDLLEEICPEEERSIPLHSIKSKNVHIILRKTDSSMERVKFFQGTDKSAGYGNQWFRDLLKEILPVRVQDLGDLMASQRSYFGTYGVTHDLPQMQPVKTFPGLVAVILESAIPDASERQWISKKLKEVLGD